MKLTVRAKIVLVCSVLLGAMALTTVLGLWQLGASDERLSHIVEVNAPAAQTAAQLATAGAKTTRAVRDLLLANSDDRRKAAPGPRTSSAFHGRTAGRDVSGGPTGGLVLHATPMDPTDAPGAHDVIDLDLSAAPTDDDPFERSQEPR